LEIAAGDRRNAVETEQKHKITKREVIVPRWSTNRPRPICATKILLDKMKEVEPIGTRSADVG
jgi:hypothetical protein